MTGLPCGEFEEGYSIDFQTPAKEENYNYWERMIGDNREVNIEDLVSMVRNDRAMPGWKKLKLCLIIIVDGVLVAKRRNRSPL